MAAGDVVLRAFAAELFPTAQRGTSSGWLILVQTLGWSSGLFLVGFWTSDLGELALAVSLTSLAAWLAGGALLLLPETGARELESISGPA